jgi:endonuclease YncB( thermonuclease family)
MRFLFALLLATSASAVQAQRAPVTVRKPIQFETGDTFTSGGLRLRLYGVQACLRDTPVRNGAGAGDCGVASIDMLAGLMASSPSIACQPIADGISPAPVVCALSYGDKVLDLGAAMIVAGYAFAAVKPDGSPVHAPYLVAELAASEKKAGLWSATFTHPIPKLLRNEAPQ